MRKIWMIVAVLLLAVSCLAQEKPGLLHFALNGFSIAPLEGTSDTATYQVVSMYLPSVDGFSPNVSVQVQPYTGTMADYLALSRQQFESLGWTLIDEIRSDSTSMSLEYTASLQGYDLHFYARALSRDNKMYLVTGAATESRWPTLSPQIIKCVDSFTLDQPE